ncbi:YbaN family protein [Sphingomonas sp. Leaf17]|uniref:YbaN family protein n=1 Tax=Sphingomonas sp. Leaf17 TaxID=1735683 RepID=UPI001F3A5DBF|nr:YbaN family protein [Sphingomonas sp. Leaf17]
MPDDRIGWRRHGWRALGLACVALGIIGAVLPLMPTTIFLILAAGCFARSSPALERRLLDHPRFGPLILGWRRERVIPVRAKIMACTGMAFGLALLAWRTWPRVWPIAGGGVVIGLCAAYVLMQRSTPGRDGDIRAGP